MVSSRSKLLVRILMIVIQRVVMAANEIENRRKKKQSANSGTLGQSIFRWDWKRVALKLVPKVENCFTWMDVIRQVLKAKKNWRYIENQNWLRSQAISINHGFDAWRSIRDDLCPKTSTRLNRLIEILMDVIQPVVKTKKWVYQWEQWAIYLHNRAPMIAMHESNWVTAELKKKFSGKNWLDPDGCNACICYGGNWVFKNRWR